MAYDTKRRKRNKPTLLIEIIRWAVEIAIVISIAYFLFYNYGEKTNILGESMQPTLLDGEKIIIDKLKYHFTGPSRFDIIVFTLDNNEDYYYIKRVIALPGETVQIKDGLIYIDNQILKEELTFEPIDNPGDFYEPITLGEDEYFVLGDNRNNSDDSRFESIGLISDGQIKGKAWLRVEPIDNITVIDKIDNSQLSTETESDKSSEDLQ